MAVQPLKLTRKLIKPVSALAVWALLVQSAVLCCTPAAAMTGQVAEPEVERHCRHDADSSPAVPDRHDARVCCTDTGPAAAQQPLGKPVAQQPAPDSPEPAGVPVSPFEAAARSPRYLSPPDPDPVRRSRPYYLSYCVFLE